MKNNYPTVVCFFLCLIGLNILNAQSSGPEFLDCPSQPTSLCTKDEGVRLPANNKIYLGEENPNATSCSVHVSQKTKVRATCGKDLRYEVQLFRDDDTSNVIILQPLTTITTDSVFEAELSFDSELSPDSIIRQNGIPYTSGCNQYHRIKWILTDSCGQTAICEKEIELYDCFKPSISNANPLYIAYCNIGGTIILHLDSIVKSPTDDCTLKDSFQCSFYQDHYQPDSSFTICDVPAFGVELRNDIWIADGGSDLNCDGTLEWGERNIEKQNVWIVYVDHSNISCDSIDPLFLTGYVETEDHQSVEKVEITLTTPGHVYPTFITGMDGKFHFIIFYPGLQTLTAERNDNYRNGVSTLDIVRIQKHLLGIDPLSSPYDIIAADANNSKSVSAIDLVELRKLVLGKYTELPSNKSWRFVPEKINFQDTLHPWSSFESLTFDPNNPGNLDFVGIKIGDVNNSVKANAQSSLPRGSQPVIKWSTDQKNYLKDEIVEINFFVNDPNEIQGFQFTISDPDLEFISAISGTINLGPEDFGLFGDKISLSWFDEKGLNLTAGDIVFTLKARAKSNGNLQHSLFLNSDITEAEMYDMNDEVYVPKLVVKAQPNSIISFLPQPNPWKDNTVIPFYLNASGKVSFEIFDLNGRSVYVKMKNYAAGNNEVTLQSSDFTARGVLYYSIQAKDFVYTNKMIVLE